VPTTAAGENEICRMDAVTVAEQIRSTRISPVEVTEAVLVAHGAPPTLYIRLLHAQLRNARADAKRIEADIMAGRAVGSLAGVAIAQNPAVFGFCS
jgi:aspartyl-tRNA(Asn)/glutamyl-tRNA(Gln) amidotransferase subunit A